jgi:hypothetical protein
MKQYIILACLLTLTFIISEVKSNTNWGEIYEGSNGQMCMMGGKNPQECWRGTRGNTPCCYCPNCGGAFSCVFAPDDEGFTNNKTRYIIFNNKNQTINCSGSYLSVLSLTAFALIFIFN